MDALLSQWFHVFCICLLVVPVSSCQSNVTSPKPDDVQVSQVSNRTPVNDHPVEQELNIDGLYYGTQETNGFISAVVFRLDKNGGYLYKEHAVSQISGLEIKTPDHIRFQVERKPDDIYMVFDGNFDSEHIMGKFRFLSKDAGKQNDNPDESIANGDANSSNNRKLTNRVESDRISFQKLKISSSLGCQGGFFTNREFNKESGDMDGAEVLLIPTSGELFGVYTSGNGDVSYAFDTHIQDNKFEFEITQGGEKPKFLGVCAQNKVMISYVSEGADTSKKPLVLLRRPEISDSLIKEPR